MLWRRWYQKVTDLLNQWVTRSPIALSWTVKMVSRYTSSWFYGSPRWRGIFEPRLFWTCHGSRTHQSSPKTNSQNTKWNCPYHNFHYYWQGKDTSPVKSTPHQHLWMEMFTLNVSWAKGTLLVQLEWVDFVIITIVIIIPSSIIHHIWMMLVTLNVSWAKGTIICENWDEWHHRHR